MAKFQKITYICPECGITSERERCWRPCERRSCYVCMNCCMKCEWHCSFSGLHVCTCETDLKRMRKKQARMAARMAFLEKALQSDYAYSNATYRIRIWEKREDLKAEIERLTDSVKEAQRVRENAWESSEYIRRMGWYV